MTAKLKILTPIIVLLLVSPALATEFTYKEYVKASEVWKRGFVFGISRYMATVAQPDEEPPYPVRAAFSEMPWRLNRQRSCPACRDICCS